MRQIHRGTILVTLILLLTSSAGSGRGAHATAPRLTGAPLKLMVVFEGSGPVPNPETPEGAIAAAKAINAAGGIKGRPLQIIPCDTKSDPNIATGCGRRAISRGVVALVGSISLFDNWFMPLLATHKIASIGVIPETAIDFTSPAAFPIEGGAAVNYAGLTAALAERGAKKIALARVDIPAATALVQFANAGVKRFGLTVRDVPVPAGAPDMAPYVAAALKDGTDGIVVTEPAQDAVNYVQAVRQADPSVKMAMLASAQGDVNRVLGKTADGILEIAAATTTLKNKAERQFEKDMKAAGYSNLAGQRLNTYASVLVFRQIAQRLSNITAQSVSRALAQARGISTGFTPPLQFVKGGIAGLPRVFNPCLLPMRVENGKQVPLTGKFENAFTGKECPISG